MSSFHLLFVTFVLTVLSVLPDAIFARVVPRRDAPADYNTSTLEAYSTYHTRYLALGCQNQHGTSFFDDCCHPLLANETASSECTPTSSALVSASAAEAADTTTAVAAATTSSTNNNAALFAHTSTSSENTHAGTPTSTSSTAASTSTSLITGGVGTYFYQNGVAGACGTVHSDTDYIVAVDSDRYGNTGEESSLCGKQVTVINTANQKSVTCTIADACPTCENSNSLDLSVAAFEAIAELSTGEIDIEWSFD